MSVLGIGSLTWYYASSMTRQSRAQAERPKRLRRAARRAMRALPSIGRIDPPPPPPVTAPPDVGHARRAARRSGDAAGRNRRSRRFRWARRPGAAAYAPPPPPTPEQIAQARELVGCRVLQWIAACTGGACSASERAPRRNHDRERLRPAGPASRFLRAGRARAAPAAPAAASVRAQMLPAQRLLLPKGAFIDCTLETAIDSSLPGMTTCILATDTFGVDGKVVLLERGTKLIGETRGQVQQGTARVFVLWTEARTPTGVVVPLDSPGADELGRSGLAGEVNRHFWERFGAAMLISVVDGAVQTAATRNSGRHGRSRSRPPPRGS